MLQERKAEALRQGGLVTYKNQVSYGLHIIVVMAVFYLIGHLITSRISDKVGLVRLLHFRGQIVWQAPRNIGRCSCTTGESRASYLLALTRL